ncbi:MAG: hypothetical protein IT331_25720 [Anaerolineae bacterium]|nr:hypothetical protein [Anaerolineae bacterium]
MASTPKKSKAGAKKTTGARASAGKSKGAKRAVPGKRRAAKKGPASGKKAAQKNVSARAAVNKGGAGKRAKKSAPARKPRAATGAPLAAALKPPPHILVFAPGFLGSRLRDKQTGKIVWLDFSTVPLNPLEWEGWLDDLFQTMLYPNSNLEPAGLIEDVMFLPPWIKQEQYGRLLKTFSDWGYAVDPKDPNANELNAYTFPYDWRQDQRISARQLGERIKELRALHPNKQVWLMGHSGGGIISRWLIEKEGGDKLVDRLFLLASPWDGSPKAVYMLFQGMDTLFRLKFNAFNIPERTRTALQSFPAIYQLIPQARSFLRSATGETVDPFEGSAWLDDPHHIELLQDGRKFNQALGNHLSVKDAVAFLGRKLETTTGGIVAFDHGTRWQHIEWTDQELGDGTLPEYSAFFADARVNAPVVADHGEIYISPALMDLLRVELIDKFVDLQAENIADKKPQTNATLTFNRQAYVPGEQGELEIQLRAVKDGDPVKRAVCEARVKWLQALPGAVESGAPDNLPEIVFETNRDTPGLFKADFTAPAKEGYYKLETKVKVPNQAELLLQDMFVVEEA